MMDKIWAAMHYDGKKLEGIRNSSTRVENENEEVNEGMLVFLSWNSS